MKILDYLSQRENITVKSHIHDYEFNFTHVIATNNNEYLIFKNEVDSATYAIHLAVSNFDDPVILEQLNNKNLTVTNHISGLIFNHGAEHILSYDQQHRLVLPKKFIAYRIL